MLQVARLAPRLLSEAAPRVTTFFEEQFNPDGGAADRAGQSDLYYTVFALEGLVALQADLPSRSAAAWLETFGAGDDLDLVHLCCLARCWADLPRDAPPIPVASGLARNLARFASADGGYANQPGAERGTIYHAFLALGAHQDLGQVCPHTAELAACVAGLRSQDGAYANTPELPLGSTTVTAAAVTLLRQLEQDVPAEVGPWLLTQAHPQGGFRAGPQTPLPDLLSTATALHALAGLQLDFSSIKDTCLDFIDSLWTGRAFCGHWADEQQDSEYTFYALLALGHLSL